VIAYLIGGSLGMIGPYVGGTTDRLIARSFDLVLALPSLLMVLVIVAGMGDSTLVVILSVALVYVPRVGRVIRGATQQVVTNEYMAAARLRGERAHDIVLREILPNIAGPAVADAALRLTFAIIFISTLNFLGIGADPPSSSWGLMIAEARRIIRINPWATVAPAVGIAILTIGANLLADALARRALRQSNDRPIL
jgi:peptide/nickel transport system permease protein